MWGPHEVKMAFFYITNWELYLPTMMTDGSLETEQAR